mgnify:CR=1 FL=1
MKGQLLVLLAATVAIFLATGIATPKHLSAAPASTTQHRSPTVTTTTPVTGTATRTSVVRTPTLTATPCSCSGDLYNCKDFGSADDAQTCYEYCKARVGYDVHKLDRDNDGIACESR